MTMDRRSLLAVARAGFAILGLVAVLTQLTDLANRGVLVPFNFFSYFTIASNLLTIAVTDPKSGTAEFKACAVRVDKIAPVGAAHSTRNGMR